MTKNKQHMFDKPQNVKRLIHSLYAICFVLFMLDFVINRHVNHWLERIWGFYAIYGFIACVILVLIAKWMRTFLMREESYYTRNENTGNIDSTQQKNGTHHVDK